MFTNAALLAQLRSCNHGSKPPVTAKLNVTIGHLGEDGAQCVEELAESESVTMSFRVNPRLRSTLQKEAARKHVSLNAYGSDALNRSVEWFTLVEKFDFIQLSASILASILEEMDEQKLAAVARRTYPDRLRDLAYALNGKADLHALRRVLELMARYQYTLPVSYSWREDSNGSQIFLRHGISAKWSIFLGEGILSYLDNIGLNASYEWTVDSIKLTIPRKSRQMVAPVIRSSRKTMATSREEGRIKE